MEVRPTIVGRTLKTMTLKTIKLSREIKIHRKVNQH